MLTKLSNTKLILAIKISTVCLAIMYYIMLLIPRYINANTPMESTAFIMKVDYIVSSIVSFAYPLFLLVIIFCFLELLLRLINKLGPSDSTP